MGQVRIIGWSGFVCHVFQISVSLLVVKTVENIEGDDQKDKH